MSDRPPVPAVSEEGLRLREPHEEVVGDADFLALRPVGHTQVVAAILRPAAAVEQVVVHGDVLDWEGARNTEIVAVCLSGLSKRLWRRVTPLVVPLLS
jgi:hypothetical protein